MHTFTVNALVGRGVSAALSGISTLASRLESAIDRARGDDGGFGAQAAMIGGGLIAVGVVVTIALRNTGQDAAVQLSSARVAAAGVDGALTTA